jgi:IrrE N-terminal-like domain
LFSGPLQSQWCDARVCQAMATGSEKPLWRVIRESRPADARPHHVANVILRRLEIFRPPVPVEEIVPRLGVRVLKTESPGWIGAVDSTIDPPTVWIDSDDFAVRQRFTLGHELGHLLLHPLGRKLRDANFARKGDVEEAEANEFAAALLIPLWMLEPIVVGTGRSPQVLASMFGVSQGALSLQLRKLR